MVKFPNSWILIDYLSISTGSFVTNHQLSPFIGLLSIPMSRKSRQLVADELVEFEREPVEVGTSRGLPIILE
jgi:hypothetical protein